jgi:adenine-specific DNA-methyltransferase
MATKTKEELLEENQKLKDKIEELKNRKKYGLVWEDKPEDVVERCKAEMPILNEVSDLHIENNDDEPTHLMIEGDNYHALSILNYTHRKDIDVIYIDPPYNTGDESWKYNNNYVDESDKYRHSKWISFMSNRLELAQRLLAKDGVLVCTVDKNEQEALGLLLEEIFPNYEKVCVTIVHNPRGIQGKNFSYTHEYAYFLYKKDGKCIARKKIDEDERDYSNFRNWGGESKREDGKNSFYPIYLNEDGEISAGSVPDESFHPDQAIVEDKEGRKKIWPIDSNGVERKWRYSRDSFSEVKNLLRVKETRNGLQVQIGKDQKRYKTVWADKKYDASTYGTRVLSRILKDTDFPFPKSIRAVEECIMAASGGKKDPIILDYFAGSGTTAHAAMKLNRQDNGNRKTISVTNNEGDIARGVCQPRIKKAIEGYSYDSRGNTHEVEGLGGSLKYYKTNFVGNKNSTTPSDSEKIELSHNAGEMIAVREDTLAKEDETDWWQIFSAEGQLTAVYFRENKSQLNNLVRKLGSQNKPVSLYVFSWSTNAYNGEFSEYDNIEVDDIPQPILEVYREINQL